METNSGGLESEDLMEMEEGEGSDLDDEEEELDDPISSPFQLALSDPASAATSTASSPPNNDDIPITPYTFSGKPLSIKRGRGRPRREGDKAVIRRSGAGTKVRRTKNTGYMRGIRRVKSLDRSDFDFSNIIPSPNDENLPMLDSDFGLFGISEREKMMMALEENPYPPEQWPGKVCALCNLGERSQLGQGDLMRLLCPDGFTPQRSASNTSNLQSVSDQVPDNESGDKSPRGPVTCRRQKSFNKCRMLSQTNEYIDELSIIGYTDEPDLQSIFESLGIFFVHRRCATWSDGVVQHGLQNIGPVILQSTSRKCSYCNHFGASLTCNVDVCSKYYHFPCATAAGAFQDSKAVTNYCVQHLVQVPIVCESAVCYTCKLHGDIANLMFCSSCGEHYHGICVGLAQTPGIRAGWQCRKCRICQICRSIGDETKLMPCEQCDKVYHTTCQRPIVTSIPKYGWKCRCCRVCGDCGSRTPGAGSSSRWHNHYSVCDSCYQQRNKGYACPICGRSYRAHAQREMVQCITCRRFVHGTCDPEADMMTYQVRKDSHPDYEYACGVCKSDLLKKQQIQQQRNSFEDGDSFSGSQDYLFDDAYDFDYGQLSDDSVRFMGLGRGKPYSASKIAKKRLGISIVGRPKGIGKGMAGKLGFAKRQRLVEFGRKRGPKSKMRGMFGVPGVGLQRPTSDGSRTDEEPGVENRLVLCSVKDKYVLNQDICVMCGALGTDQEGCLISCVQCGQCYHPYCVNVKVTRVILQKGWRCLDCTVCEGCGHRHDEGRLILCDECDISFHIYCMDPPLEYVPHGNWKCKWCAICQMCGATDPGFNCSWMNSYTECGPCASHTACASCSENYNDGELIVQCIQCERWLHGSCDSIRNEKEAEKCVEDGYNCILCRPRDVPPPHLQLTSSPKPSTPCKSPDIKSNTPYFMDGISLQESGYIHIKSLSNTPSITRKKRKKFHPVQDKEAGIMATIESVIAGSNTLGGSLDASSKLELMDIKEDPQDLYKEGMLWTKEDGTPPEGFTLYTMESGVSVLRRKRQRNLQKLGIGGFIVRPRGIRGAQDNDDVDMLPGQLINESLNSQSIMDGDKPRRKPNRRKPKSKVFENYPPHIQEAFFGKLSLETAKGLDSTSDSEEESIKSSKIGERTIQLSQDELRAVVAVTKHEKSLKQLSGKGISSTINKISNSTPIVPKEEDESDTEGLKDVLTLPGDLLDAEIVNTIMNEDDDELTKNTDALEALGDSNLPDDSNSTSALKETGLTDILGSHFNIESIPNINSKDVEDIFKNVLTDESQESQESSSFPMSNTNTFSANSSQPATTHPLSTAIRPTSLPTNNLNSPVGFPPQSPYHSEYSNSPQFSEPRSPWVTVNDTSDLEPASTPGVTTTYNQRSAEKMKADEGLGSGATISAVLYANMNHPEWKTDYPVWNDRYKQIIKKWRTLSTEQRAPYLQQARDNRSALRMKKQQQDQEKINQQQKTAREAEQERQWKQLQAIRQQQQQQHHVVLQEQRTQAIANVQRSLSDSAQPFMTDQVGVLQVTSQQISPSSPSSATPQFYPLNIKGNQITNSHSPQSKMSQSPTLPSSSSSSNTSQTIIDSSNLQKLSHPPTLHNKTPLEPTIHMPTTPRLQFTTTRPNLQAFTSPVRQGDAPEMNPQLRDLLQRQQFKKLDEQLLPGKGQQRVWPPTDLSSIQDSDQSNVTTPAAIDVTFRQPLPPSTLRPKVATSGGLVLRQGSVVGVRIPGSDPRMQSVDFRMKLLLQQQRGAVQSPLQQQFQQGAAQSRISALANNVRSSNVEQYEQILQKQAQIQNARLQNESSVSQSIIPIQRVPSIDQHVAASSTSNDSSSTDQEIPDNVTAELEKLEQETGTMVELQGVSEILGGLGEDDDDILAEMGADFNILEYADPELDTLTGGEKTNILDSLDLVEPEPDKLDKREIKARVPVPPTSVILTRPNVILKSEPTISIIPTSTTSIMSSRNLVRPSLPPPLAVSQHQASSNAQASIAQLQLTPQQQMHQQMLLQVQHASTSGQPVSAGSKLLSDGVVNVVTSSNNVSLAFPANYAQRILNTHIQLQNQKLRLGTIGQAPRVALPSPTGSPQTILTEMTSPRINLAPPPPPPPYPHPPPPYPGSSNANQEQPLLLEDLLEQEKREQEKQMQTQSNTTAESHAGSTLLSDHDFERLKADVLNSNIGLNNSGNVTVPGQNVNTGGTQIRSNFCSPNNANQWQQSPVRPSPVSTPQASIDTPQIPTFNMTLLPAPPLPPENIVSEQDRQAQVLYEQWLNNQNAILTQQLKYYETEVQKLRKIRKSLNSKQRQLRKSGNQLPEADAIELQRISAEQAVLQKHLESSRKQSRQHGMLIQVYMKEYRNKQQAKQHPMTVQSPMMVSQQSQSPLNLPNSSPIQHPPQSPLMSPSPSPMMAQHNSPLQSPRPIVSHSPGLGVVASVIHSPSNASSNMSPRIGTPHSQGEGSPGSVPSPSQVCLPPPMPRMTSPQHRRIVTSPITYSTELRPGMQQTRFVRPPINDQQHRPRLSISTANFLQRSSTPSPLNSPPPQQIQLTSQQQQQLLQRQLQQQALLLQQQNSPDGGQQSVEGTMHHSQRALQLIQQRQLIIRQQMLQQQVQQQQTQVLTSQQHQVMVQQQIAKQQQLAQIQAQVQNVRINPQSQIVNQPPSSPMPPRSPMINQGQQIMSPHSVHSQPASPMINLNPNSPMARSPALHQSNSQPPNSPMVQHHQVTSPLPRSPIIGSIKSPLSMRRPPSTNSSPIMLDHPMNIENPSTPRPQYTPPSYAENDHSNGGGGGGNPNNPHNPLPMCGRFGFFKLGLRGGAPMWSLGRGAKRIPTNSDNKEDKINSNNVSMVPSKIKRESHLNKVSILKKKASTSKSNLKSLTIGKASSLVSSDYNEFDDSSSTPPVTPPPSVASTSRGLLHKNVTGKKLLEQSEIKDEIVVDNNMRCENVMDYDDDNDGAVVSTEVSLNSVAQQADSDDITVIETFSQNDLTDTISSPLEPGQIGEDYLLFPGNMVVDISNTVHYSDKEEDEEEEEYGEQIVNVAIQSPTPSEEELISQGKTKQVTSDGLTLNIVHGLSSNQLLAVTDTPDSPEQEELNVDPSPEHYSQNTDEEILSHTDDPEVVLIGRKDLDKASNVDYEQLIDVTNEKILKRETTSSNRLTEIHKFTTKSTTANFQSVNLPITNVSQAITLNTKTTTINLPAQKLSSTSTSISNSVNTSKASILSSNVITRTAKFTNPNSPTLTSIILPIKTTASSAITFVGPSSSRVTIPVISASAVSKLTNVKVIDKPSSSLSLAAHDACLPKKIFDDESSVSPDSSTCEDEKFKLDFGDEKFKMSTLDEKQCINVEAKSCDNNADNIISDTDCSTRGVHEHSLDSVNEIVAKQLNHSVQMSNTSIKDHLQRLNSPAVISNAPELKMTAQVVQEKGNANVQVTCGNVETIQASYVTTRDTMDCSNDSDNDSKSVVISIPSPTPSQEQILDNIALQALENRRREGKRITSEFDTFEDVLDMIENITGETPTLLEANIKDKIKCDDITKTTKQESNENNEVANQDNMKMLVDDRKIKSPTELQIPVTVSTSGKSTIMPQLSPLSQPTDLTTNMANVSQQLRTLLSSLNTTTVTTSPNVATIVKSDIHNKDKVTGSSRIIQTSSILSPLISNANVIFSNAKQKPVVAFTVPSVGIVSKNILVSNSMGSAFAPITTTLSSGCSNATVTKIFTTSNSNAVQSISDHPKLTLVTSVPSSLIQSCNLVTSVSQKSTPALAGTGTATTISDTQSIKKSLNLNAMLQSHPAATIAQIAPGTITTATILGSSITIAKSSFSPSMVHAQPTVVSPVVTQAPQTHASTTSSFISFNSSGISKPIVATTNLLHSQLTKVNVLRTKTNEDQQQLTMDLIKKEEIKQEPSDTLDLDISPPILQKSEFSGCKYSAIQCTSRVEDSQNVLLKQLLQNTACATTSQSLSASTTSGTISNAPSLPLVPNLEAQLARPVPPTPTSLLPPLLQNDSVPVSPKTTMVTRETSFVSKPAAQAVTIQQLHIDVKKCLPPSRTPSRDELLSPPTPRSTCSQDSFIPTPPLYIKKEYQSMSSLPSPLLTPHEVKKEFVDESSQHSEISDHSRPDIHIKEEMDLLDSSEKTTLEQKEELKKMKRRAYQQKRRQIQTMNKEMAGQPKKRPRKSSKIDEDYDTYMEGVLAQLRTLPPMVVQEAQLHRNFGIASIFGGGDFSRLGVKNDLKCGELSGSYGNAAVSGCSDFYSTKPYGNFDPLPPKPPISTQRGFYETEFLPLRFESEDDRKFELFCRDADTPDSVVSDSSGDECLQQNDSFTKFLGLKLIDDYDDETSESKESGYGKRSMSPIVPIVVPIPIRLKPLDPYLKDYSENDKENIYKDYSSKSKLTTGQTSTLKDSGNVTVTLTLTSSAAEDIMGVLRDLANLLHIPPPTSYQIVERTGTPPSQKLGLYRTKGKDGKEGTPIDIQSILNGNAKFCKHCDVVILKNIIRKKVAELPNLSKWTEIVGDSDEIYFCSGACYMQFSIIHRIPPMPENKAATTIDYISQKETHKKSMLDHANDNALNRLSTLGRILNKQSTISDFMEVDHIKTESIYSTQHEELDFKQKHFDNFEIAASPKVWKDLRYKQWIAGCLQSNTKYKKPTDKETMELLYRLGITVLPAKLPEDTRRCMFCQNVGDGVADGPARLLNFDVDKWIHLNCGLWSDLVYETVNGALMNLENAIQISLVTVCVYCNKYGATIRCFKTRCSNIYHLPCAIKERCVFYKNKSVFCASHALKNDKDNEITTLSVSRRVYVNRDENRQVAAVMHHASDTSNLLRVGSLIFLNVGQLLPHQLQNFHTANYIYPIGYKIWRFYWSMRRVNKRCRYLCSIHEISGRPEFRVVAQDPPEEDIEFRDVSPKAVWNPILEQIALVRKENHCLQVFPKYISGEDLFGLTEPAVVRVLESLPGIETLIDYKFKYGRNPLLELPLAVNPSGAARTEPKSRNQFNWKRPHTQRTGSSVRPVYVSTATGIGEAVCPYSKQFVHSKSSQYKKMKQEWKNNIYLARSKIQGLGLYAARDLEKHTMVIEYIGEIIRTELAETREKKYEARNRGIYMFRLDEERVIDATLSGGLARYINHSCNPNCVAEIVEVDRDLRIIIFAKRRIQRGEELAYDYKFDIEDDQHKISCMCGAPNCRKWMN